MKHEESEITGVPSHPRFTTINFYVKISSNIFQKIEGGR
jgi:hypothetical protein